MGKTDNWIAWQPGIFFWSPVNIKKVRSQGLELDFNLHKKINHHKALAITVNGSYGVAENEAVYIASNTSIGKQIILVPRLITNVNLIYSMEKWQFSYLQPLVGKYFLTADNGSYMPLYSYGNIMIGRGFELDNKHKIQASLSINNISNWQYQVVPGRPMPGRHYLLILKYHMR